MTNINTNAPAVGDPCAMLPYLRAAYYDLLAGKATAEVRDGERWQRWHQGDKALLAQEIAKLEAICPRSAGNPYGGATGSSTSARNRVLGGW